MRRTSTVLRTRLVGALLAIPLLLSVCAWSNGPTPLAIRIPVIGVTSHDVAPMGLNPDQTLQVPPLSRVRQLGWYQGSPVPGDPGPAVVVAHVDGGGRLGLFSGLSHLEPGDHVEIDRADRRTAVFRVTYLQQVDKTAFPSSQVYGDTSTPTLRLITCGGQVDKIHHRYLGNVVVFASLIGIKPTR